MAVLAVSAAWVGVVGTAVGGLIGFLTSWMVHRSERASRLAERSRADRTDAYAALLTNAEHSLHLFQWLAEGQISPAGMEGDRARANTFYDQEVTPRYMVLKITGRPKVVAAAHDLRHALNDVRHLMRRKPPPPAASTEFQTAQDRYRAARDEFTKAASADLDPPRKRRRFRLVRGTGEHPH